MSDNDMIKKAMSDEIELAPPSPSTKKGNPIRTNRKSRDSKASVEAEVMERDHDYLKTITNLRIKQTRKNCCQELIGCEAQTEVGARR